MIQQAGMADKKLHDISIPPSCMDGKWNGLRYEFLDRPQSKSDVSWSHFSMTIANERISGIIEQFGCDKTIRYNVQGFVNLVSNTIYLFIVDEDPKITNSKAVLKFATTFSEGMLHLTSDTIVIICKKESFSSIIDGDWKGDLCESYAEGTAGIITKWTNFTMKIRNGKVSGEGISVFKEENTPFIIYGCVYQNSVCFSKFHYTKFYNRIFYDNVPIKFIGFSEAKRLFLTNDKIPTMAFNKPNKQDKYCTHFSLLFSRILQVPGGPSDEA